MGFFLGSLEMSAPILSGWKRKRMRKREGGLKRISEATKKTCLLTLMLHAVTSSMFRKGRETLQRDEREEGTRDEEGYKVEEEETDRQRWAEKVERRQLEMA